MKFSLLLVLFFPLLTIAQAPGADCGTAANVAINGCTGAQAGIGNNTDDGLAGSCAGTFSRDAWWKFTATSTSTQITFSNTTANDNPAIFLYGGTCAAKTFLACDNTTNSSGVDTETLTFATTNGTTYYVQIKNFGSGIFDGELCLSSIPANDLICNATTVTCGNSYNGTTVNATTTGEGALPACGTAPSAAGVWYVFNGDGSTVTADLCTGTTYDTRLNVYSGTACGTIASCTASNDDNCGLQSRVTFPTVAGTKYYILVNGYSTNTGAFTLNISCCTPGITACATLNSPANGATNVANCTNLSWTAPATAGCTTVDSYDVYFGTTNPPPFYANTTSTTYPIVGAPNTVYYWQIRPKNSSGTPAGCTIRSFTTSASGNPQYTAVDDATSPAPYDCVTLTTAINNQRGCAWDLNSTLNFAANFSYDFTVNLGNNDGGADGLSFVIQNDPLGRCKCGATGGAMGAGGISNSVIVEIDTYLNTEDRDDFSTNFIGCGGTEEPDHLDIWFNGNINPDLDWDCNAMGAGERPATPVAVRLKNGVANYNIENGLNHILRISWASGSNTLTANVLNTALSTTYGTITSTFNPMTIFGTNTPFFGFTASTGGLNNNQSFCNPPVLLPVELSTFHSYCYENYKKIYWTTQSENNHAYFSLEKSIDAQSFNEIIRYENSMKIQGEKSYEFIDYDNLFDDVYYRLVQVDLDGRKKYYDPIFSSCMPKSKQIAISAISENNDKVEFKLILENNKPHLVTIIDLTGKVLFNKTIKVESNEFLLQLDKNKFANSMYFIQLSNEDKQVNKKFNF